MKYEHLLKNKLSKRLKRGKVSVILNVEVLNENKRTLQINQVLAKKYLSEIRDLGKYLELEKEVDLQFLLELPEVIPTEAEQEDEEEWQMMESAIKEAIEHLIESRMEEGKALDEDLRLRREAIGIALEKLKKLAPRRIDQVRNRIDSAMDEIRRKIDTDQNRFEQELIFYIEKLDINEEMVRLEQHLNFFKQLQEEDKSNGKQLQFLSQEMGREINTIGSKANDAEIQRLVVGMKNELEKIKEQVLNIV
jgi:uncharacterized protein (TIGR00255 family)